MLIYDHLNIEQKWQKKWKEQKTFAAENSSSKSKYYVLDMFPYPSGAGLHVGHPEGYTATDIISRLRRHQGYNVLHPMGWDAFGLPAENFAIKTGIHPKISTADNIANFTKQIQSLGFSYDWNREIDTTDPEYYKWSQWIFLQLFKNGLAYEKEMVMSWCPTCKIVAANEEVENGVHERCGNPVEKRQMRQWMLKITQYADRLLNDLDDLDWTDAIKEMQRNWIGKSEGAEIKFVIANPEGVKQSRGENHNSEISSGIASSSSTPRNDNLSLMVYTTRPDTLFGCTYMVLAPEHELVSKITTEEQKDAVEAYVQSALQKSERERKQDEKEKTGVFTGAYAINPANGKHVPIWVADYVLAGYGTGAIMAVPAHDERDFEFAEKFGLEVVEVVEPVESDGYAIRGGKKVELEPDDVLNFMIKFNEDGEPVSGGGSIFDKKTGGKIINSDFLNGLSIENGKETMSQWLEEKGIGSRQINFKLRDWVFTRQRYWGEPIPLVHCQSCGIVPADPEFAKYPHMKELVEDVFKHNKKEGDALLAEPSPKVSDGCSTKDYSVDPSFYASILASKSYLCKRSRSSRQNTQHFKKGVESVKNPFLGEVIVPWGNLYNHFRKKHKNEFFYRLSLGKNMVEVLENAEEYFVSKKEENHILIHGKTATQVVSVVLYKYKDVWQVKTFYTSCTLSSAWQKLLKNCSLPLKLPETANYEPTESGESPLAAITDWVNTTCPCCGKPAKRETSTMPNWAGSSWYWLRFMDPKNKELLVGKEAEKYWQQVDLYVGGAEHAVLHLLYARFWHKFLFDIGLVTTKEPFQKLVNQGMILAFSYKNEHGKYYHPNDVEEKNGKFYAKGSGELLERQIEKMSKSKLNVVNPDDVVEEYGADTLRMYEMFMGPFDQTVVWDTQGVVGIRRFLEKVAKLEEKVSHSENTQLEKLLHKTIKKVTEDTEDFKFNTAISGMMVFVNEALKSESIPKNIFETFLLLLHPYAPHLAEELFERQGNKESLDFFPWPKQNEELCKDDEVTIAVQVNGKLRDTIPVAADASKEQVLALAKASHKVQNYLTGDIKKEIYVPGKLVSFVV